MLLKRNQKITFYKSPFCFFTCVTVKMFKYSDKMCWLGKHGRQWLLEAHLQKKKKTRQNRKNKQTNKQTKNPQAQRLGAILPPVTQIFVSTTNMLLEK